jgi:hypothetical protein
VQVLDAPVIGCVVPSFRVHHRPRSILGAVERAEFFARRHVPEASCNLHIPREGPYKVSSAPSHRACPA